MLGSCPGGLSFQCLIIGIRGCPDVSEEVIAWCWVEEQVICEDRREVGK